MNEALFRVCLMWWLIHLLGRLACSERARAELVEMVTATIMHTPVRQIGGPSSLSGPRRKAPLAALREPA